MKRKDYKSEVDIFRQKAEELLKLKPTNLGSLISETDPLKLIHDLEVNQIALEMQNDELRLAISTSQDAIELYDFAPMGYFTLSNGGEIKRLNYCGARMLGKKSSRLINSQFNLYMTDETRPIFNQFLKKIFGGKNKESCNLTLLTNDILPVYVQVTGIINKKGDQCLLTAVDISELKRAQDKLAQTQKNYETFFNTIDDFLFVVDLQGKIVHVNETVTDRLNYTRAELLKESILMVYPPERRDEAGIFFNEILNGVSNYFTIPVMTKPGVQIPVETKASHGFWDDRPVVFEVTKDITKLALSEEKFSKLFFINPSASGLTDLINGEYIEINEAFCDLLGFDKVEVIGKTPVELGIFTPDEIKSTIERSRNKGTTHNISTDLRTKTGEIKHVLMSSEVIDVQDKKMRYTVIHDLTDRK